MTKIFESRFSSDGLEGLRCLLGTSVREILSPGAWGYRTWANGMSFLVRCPRGYLVFSNGWDLTPVEELTLQPFRIEALESPRGLITDIQEDGREVIRYPFTEIMVGAPKQRHRTSIQRILVYEFEEVGANQRVVFDSAVQLFRSDGMEVLLAADLSALGGVACSYNKTYIRGHLQGHSVRLVLE